MSTFALVRRSLARTVRRHRLIAVLVLLLVLATVVLSWLARGATHGTSRGLTESLGAKEIEVIQGYSGPNSPPLNTNAVTQLGKLDGVEHVFPSGISGIDPPADIADSEDGAGPWWLTPRNPFDDRMKDAHSNPAAFPEPGQMLVPGKHENLVGKTIEVNVTRAVSSTSGTGEAKHFTVIGTYDPETVQGEPPDAVFINSSQFNEIQAAALPPDTPPYSSIYLYVGDVNDVAKVQKSVEDLGYGTRSAIGSGIQLDRARQGLVVASVLVLFVTILGALFAGTSVAGTWMTSHIEEIGLFRSLGWTRRAIVRFYLLEALIFALCVSAIGVLPGVGVVMALAALPSLLTSVAGFSMDPGALLAQAWVVAVPLIAVPLGFIAGAGRRAATLLRVDTDTLLRQI